MIRAHTAVERHISVTGDNVTASCATGHPGDEFASVTVKAKSGEVLFLLRVPLKKCRPDQLIREVSEVLARVALEWDVSQDVAA